MTLKIGQMNSTGFLCQEAMIRCKWKISKHAKLKVIFRRHSTLRATQAHDSCRLGCAAITILRPFDDLGRDVGSLHHGINDSREIPIANRTINGASLAGSRCNTATSWRNHSICSSMLEIFARSGSGVLRSPILARTPCQLTKRRDIHIVSAI